MTRLRKLLSWLRNAFVTPAPSAAWSAGYEAFQRDGIQRNPYQRGTAEFRDWNDGYAEARLLENQW